eukprot:gene11203-biopygen3337
MSTRYNPKHVYTLFGPAEPRVEFLLKGRMTTSTHGGLTQTPVGGEVHAAIRGRAHVGLARELPVRGEGRGSWRPGQVNGVRRKSAPVPSWEEAATGSCHGCIGTGHLNQ